MKIIVRLLKFIFVLFLGVSLSYILVSCSGGSISDPGEVSVDIMPALPVVAINQTDYTQASIQNTFADTKVHARFTKAYQMVYTASLKETIVGFVGITIKDLGGDSDNFIACLNSIDNIKNKEYLPCVVESAKFEGKDAWIMEFNWGADRNDLGHIAYCAVEKSTQKVLYWSSCN